MPVFGDLATMSLADVLQWVAVSQKTGVLEIERYGVSRQLEFRKGYIASCSSDDPELRLGAFAVARGRIRPDQLAEAQRRHAQDGQRIGWILLELGALDEQGVARLVAAHVEDALRDMFDWDSAVFRFHEGATLDPDHVEVSVSVRDVLMRGIQYRDEVEQLRETFGSSGAVLRRTDKQAPESLMQGEMARRILESIDGQRTLGELMQMIKAPDVLMLKLLQRCLILKLVEIVETHGVAPGATLLDRLEGDRSRHPTTWEIAGLPAPGSGTSESGAVAAGASHDEDDVAPLLIAARELHREGASAAARRVLELAERRNPEHPELETLRQRRRERQASGEIDPARVPVAREAGEDFTGPMLAPVEAYLLSLIDGHGDVNSIITRGALAEQDILDALGRMVDRGLIDVDTGAELVGAGESADGDAG